MKSLIFEGLNENEIDQFLKRAKAKEVSYSEGSFIFEMGDVAEVLYMLLEGSIVVDKVDINGRRVIINQFTKPGTIFGEVYLFIGRSLDYNCISTVNSKVLEIPKEALFEDEKTSNIIKKNLITILANKAFHLSRRLQVVSSFSLRQKIINYLLQEEVDGVINLLVNREEFSNLLSVSRPSLSRELMNMENDGLIKVENKKITILKKLRDIEA